MLPLSAQVPNPMPKVIPTQKSWVGKKGFHDTYLHFRVESVSVSPKDAAALKSLTDLLENELDAKTIGEETNQNNLHLKLDTQDKALATTGAYKLIIKDNVTITAKDTVGLYYGTRTLQQMMRTGALPEGEVIDSPQYPVRSLLIDVGRKFMTVDQLKDWIRIMGWYKMNELHLHLNDNSWGRYPGYRLESKKFPGLASKDGHYTFEQIRELQDFAKIHGVVIVPEIDSPGHSLAFTTYRPDLAHPGINRGGFGLAYLDLRNPDAIKFMEDIWDEVCPLFDSPLVHIGTDEYRLNLIKDKKERDALGESFRKYINHLNQYIVKKHGKTVRTWSGYEHMPGTTEPDKSVIIDMWETTDAKAKVGNGYKVVNSSHFYTYIVPGAPYYGVNNKFIHDTWTPRQFSNKPEGKLDNDDGLMGGKLHIWNDFGPSGYTWNEIARLSQPAIATMSEKLWGGGGKESYQKFRELDEIVGANIPNVHLMQRDALKESKGNQTIWSSDKPQLFIANSNKPLGLKTENLEWPWTASFTITRHNDIIGDETLISSKLAAFYLDYTHKSVNKKTKEETTKRGVACVRANQAFGYDPSQAYNPDHLVFNYQVPVGKQVTLTFVGEERKTSLYVDGKLIQTIGKQMVCPLTRLGDPMPKSFHGTIHKATILASAPEKKKIGAWDSTMVTEEFTDHEIEITEDLKGSGDYAVEFDFRAGLHRLNIEKVQLLENGEVISEDIHNGHTGGKDVDNIYTVKLKKHNPDAKYTLNIRTASDGGTDSQGIITIGRKMFK